MYVFVGIIFLLLMFLAWCIVAGGNVNDDIKRSFDDNQMSKELEEYYKKEYSRIVNRFIWNVGSIFCSFPVQRERCKIEALREVENVFQSSVERQNNTIYGKLWAIREIEGFYKRNFK